MTLTPSNSVQCPIGDYWDLCFTCNNIASVSTTFAFSSLVPPIGLQISPPEQTVDHYGPPGSPSGFTGQEFDLSAPAGSRDVDWYLEQEGTLPQVLDVWEGEASGTLEAEQQTSVLLGPLPWVTEVQGIQQATVSFFDDTYDTRTPVHHVVHVGLDGFGLFPETPFVGEGPGAPHGASKQYGARNRWAIDQSITVSRPGEAPWLRLNDLPDSEVDLALSPGETATVNLVLDATNLNLAPDVYVANVTWTLHGSGEPEYFQDREVRMDLCRDIYALGGLPAPFSLLPGQVAEFPLVVDAPGETVRDVDATVHLTASGTPHPSLRVALYHDDPGHEPVEVELEAGAGGLAVIFDDETYAPNEPLSGFDTMDASGEWILRLEHTGSQGRILGQLQRFETRLHVNPAVPCV